ncbi:MAG: PepSY-associated TM helix domain-containing protein [Gemmatimonadales bacterium]
MPLRKVVFWIHLACGLSAGVVILMMSATGVLLMYEKQLEEWSDRRYWSAPADPGARAPISVLLDAARAHDPGAEPTGVTLHAADDGPAAVTRRGQPVLYLDPSTAEVRGEATTAMRSFFGVVTGWHRWFNITGEGRTAARAVTGWSNLVFLFLVVSGIYLWFPRRWRWQHFRPVLLFTPGARGKARDFNWHHVFGFWAALPLALIVASATVISFPWASDLAYRVMGDEPPVRRAPAPPPAAPASPPVAAADESDAPDVVPFDPRALDALAAVAIDRVPGWRTITFPIPAERGDPVAVRIDEGWGGQPQLRHTVTYDPLTGRETAYIGFQDQSKGARLRSYLRFAHTGEYHGLLGQTVAGIASLAGVFLVWTGFALAWRRLVSPLFPLGARSATVHSAVRRSRPEGGDPSAFRPEIEDPSRHRHRRRRLVRGEHRDRS